MVASLLNERGRAKHGRTNEQPPDPVKPLSELWTGAELLPTTRIVAIDIDGKPGDDVKVAVRLEARDGGCHGRIVGVKPIDEAKGDVTEFRPEHRREAIEKGQALV